MVGALVDLGVNDIIPGYHDVWGREHRLEADVRRSLRKALGHAAKKGPAKRVTVGTCHEPEALREGGRLWGFGVQLYALRSQRNWGIGDFGDLRLLAEIAASLGASFVGVNPLHAAGVSPYSPSSRHALNSLYLEIEAIPEYQRCNAARELVASKAFAARLAALREAELVDHAGVAAAKGEVLELLHACFLEDRDRLRRWTNWERRQSRPLRDYALYEALAEKLGRTGWPSWPPEYRDPRSAAVRAFAKANASRVGFHSYVQWNARLQRDLVQKRALELGMPIGLYVDLALGADRGGAEVWSDRASYVTEVSVGAPPDDFNPLGQDWGLPPYSPHALRASGFRAFAELLRANMPEGGALRIDHVMALSRLYWIPSGNAPQRGGYVRYPFEELLATLAAESRRHRCLVVGEDLGTVAPDFRAALDRAGVLSYRPLFFAKDASGEFLAPSGYPREALVCLSTHDLPTWRGYLEASDLKLRAKLGIARDARKERASRENEKRGLAAALARNGFGMRAEDAHRFLARTPSKLLVVQPEDVFELTEQANLPGTVEEHPNWRRKIPVPLEAWRSDPRVERLANALCERAFESPGAPRAPAHRPVATYRLQLHRGFGFRDAERIVPYLAKLGVSHVYASPFLMARPGSVHGYDIVDHGRLNPEIGTEVELESLLATLRRHAMGLVLDVVPNHMGVLHGDNPWWQDVLARGRASRFARFFDIDWERGGGRLLLPVLGKHYGEALDDGDIRLERDTKAREWQVAYFEQRFPLARESVRGLRATRDPIRLHELLEKQHYRLAYWRVASDEINYRRFFEIAELAALRTEDPEVFEATHALIGRLARTEGVEGLRIDHPDGLADPGTYLERLQKLALRPWIVVEKITASHESLPVDWNAHGTTGYRFANLLTGAFIDPAAASRFDRIYQGFTGDRRDFDEHAHASRLLIMNTTLAAELNGLAARLARIARGNRRTRDYTESGLRKALSEIAAAFPVYRTYVTMSGASETDRRHIEWAVNAARNASRIADASVFDFVRDVLTLDAAPADGERRRRMAAFCTRFQQFTAPVVAKGVEDTAFYRYNRLIALNEVGNDPRAFGFSLKAFHAASRDRARHWPYTMLGTSTHDTKRSEDTRARIGVLSEMGAEWSAILRRWHLANRRARTGPPERGMPSRGDEYHFYQALLGIWPASQPSRDATKALVERLAAYMLKAAREAKVKTSWINPDAEYEAALERFVRESIANPLFVRELNEVVPRIARLGMLVSLSQALVKVASPGVPDYYQGMELFEPALVDPDNRRPVDYAIRRRLLERMPANAADLLGNLADGRAKMLVIQRGLALRRAEPRLFQGGEYLPLDADGGRERNVCAFALRRNGRVVVAVAPRLFARLMKEGDVAPLGEAAWGESRLRIPPGPYENVMTRERLEAGAEGTALAGLLGTFPVALLVSTAPNR